MINVAVIGCGRIAGRFEDILDTKKPCTHAGAYIENTHTQLVAACDFQEDSLSTFCERWNITSPYTDPVEMLTNEKIEVLSICTPVDSHYELVMLALKHCPTLKAIWCEKPISNSIKDAHEMIDECRKRSVLLAVNYWRRWDPFHIGIVDEIKSGVVGLPYVLDCQSHVGLMNCGTHLIDLAMMYLDDEPASVIGKILSDGSNDPGACGIISFKNGKQAFIDCGWKENPRLGINVRGERGTLSALTNQVLLDDYDVQCATYSRSISRDDTLKAPMSYALENILACLDGDAELLSTGTMAAKSLEVAVALYASHETGKSVVVPIKNEIYKNRNFECRITSMTKNGKIPEGWKE